MEWMDVCNVFVVLMHMFLKCCIYSYFHSEFILHVQVYVSQRPDQYLLNRDKTSTKITVLLGINKVGLNCVTVKFEFEIHISGKVNFLFVVQKQQMIIYFLCI